MTPTWYTLPPFFMPLTPMTGLQFSTAVRKICSGSVSTESALDDCLCLRKNNNIQLVDCSTLCQHHKTGDKYPGGGGGVPLMGMLVINFENNP